MNIIQKLILKGNPDYDFDRYRFDIGDIVNNTRNYSIVLVIESALDYLEAIVIKRGFGVNKGEVLRVNYDDLEYFSKGEYIKPEYSYQHKLRYEAGDIIKDNGVSFCVISRENKTLTIMALEQYKFRGIYLGAKYCITDPYWDYHYGENNA